MKLRSVIVNEQGDFLHHAFLIEGERESILPELFQFFEKELKFSVKGNPDFFYQTIESFGIDEGRRLKELQSSKAISGKKRFFVIDSISFTSEAQNSLLKVFEDPVPNTHFFIVVPSADGVLSTLKSRFLIVEHETKYQDKNFKFSKAISAYEFLKSDKAHRLAIIRSVVDEKNKSAAQTLLNDIELILHQGMISYRNGPEEKTSQVTSTLVEISKLRQYLHDRSPSIKLIMEHLAAILPSA